MRRDSGIDMEGETERVKRLCDVKDGSLLVIPRSILMGIGIPDPALSNNGTKGVAVATFRKVVIRE